jgi:uncharacterized protein YbaA (DUF1428 family)
MGTAEQSTTVGYVDIYTLPVPKANIEEYRQQATTFGTVAKELGALSYREFLGDDLGDNLHVADDHVLTAAVVEFESRAHRDDVMKRVLEDPRVVALEGDDDIADMGKMSYGGFETFVSP